MAHKVQTTDGVFVTAGPDKAPYDEAQAQADAKVRNERAVALGIKTRYEAVEA